jgi:hypothetical protein
MMQWPVEEELVCDILLHKKVHFGDSFDVMLKYYEEEEHIGIINGITKKDIIDVYQMVLQDETLEDKLVDNHHLDQIEHALEQYRSIKTLIEIKGEYNDIYQLFVDLVFSENDKEGYIETILNHKHKDIVLDQASKIIEDPRYYSNLSPGYGFLPISMMKLVGRTKDKRWMKPLFNALLRYGSSYDDVILTVMAGYHDQVKQSMLQKLQSTPYSKDNERAALILGVSNLNNEERNVIYSFLLQQMEVIPVMLSEYVLSLLIEMEEHKKLNLKKQLRNRIREHTFIF